jgi:hypothetical protein
VSNGEKVFVEGVKGSIPGFSITYQENDDMFIEDMYVEHISVTDFKKKLDDIYRSTESPSQYNTIHDNIKDIILNDLIREDEERNRRKDIWKDQQTYDRSFSCPEVLEHDKFPGERLAAPAERRGGFGTCGPGAGHYLLSVPTPNPDDSQGPDRRTLRPASSPSAVSDPSSHTRLDARLTPP